MAETKVSKKILHSDLEDEENVECDFKQTDTIQDDKPKASKVNKHDLDLPTAEADIKLAEKLDSCLKLSEARFFTNKPKASPSIKDKLISLKIKSTDHSKMREKEKTKEQIAKRLISKYDSLVPELDPLRTKIKVVKVLSAKESLEMAKEQAKKQLVDQMELNSISGNQRAHVCGLDTFKFNDGYEMPYKSFYSKKFDTFMKSKSKIYKIDTSKTTNDDVATTTTEIRTSTTESKTSHNPSTKVVKFNDHRDEVKDPMDFFALDDESDLTDVDEDDELDAEPDDR